MILMLTALDYGTKVEIFNYEGLEVGNFHTTRTNFVLNPPGEHMGLISWAFTAWWYNLLKNQALVEPRQ